MDRYEWCGVEPGSEVKNVSGRGRKKDVKAMNIAKIHVWKVPVLLYGDLYIHGQGGRKEEAESFAEIATNYGWQVISVDLPEHGERKDKARFVPWEVIPELQKIMKSAKENWKVIGIYACSIGAYFSIQAFQNTKPDICLLVSPVLDMELRMK